MTSFCPFWHKEREAPVILSRRLTEIRISVEYERKCKLASLEAKICWQGLQIEYVFQLSKGKGSAVPVVN